MEHTNDDAHQQSRVQFLTFKLTYCSTQISIPWYYRLPPHALDNDSFSEYRFVVTLVPAYVVTYHRKFKSLNRPAYI